MGGIEIWGWERGGRGSSTNCSSPFGSLLEAEGFRGASENSRNDAEFERAAVDEGVGWFIGAELVIAEFAGASVEEVSVGTVAAAEEFWADSCDTGVVDFLLRKRVAAPRRVPTITTIMAAIFQ
jgi:hypothetical protein